MKSLFQRTKMLDEAKQGIIKKDEVVTEPLKPNGHNVIVEILIFIVVLLVVNIVSTLPIGVSETVSLMSNEQYIALTQQLSNGEITVNEYKVAVTDLGMGLSSNLVLPTLLTTGITTILVMVFCRFIEKRKLSSMGFRKSGAVKEYLVGVGIGIGIFTVCVGICLITGGLKFEGISKPLNVGMILLYLLGFLIQGMSEETVCRGYLMVSVTRRSPVAVAVIVSSLMFACGHLLNPGISVIAFINITLFGAFMGIYILKRGNIWGACAIHSLWNFVQGNLYGISVSGMNKLDSIINMSIVEGKDLINGGSFGLEGGLPVTIVIVIGTVIILLTKTKKEEISEETNM